LESRIYFGHFAVPFMVENTNFGPKNKMTLKVIVFFGRKIK